MAAKPIIDMYAVHRDEANLGPLVDTLRGNGRELRGGNGISRPHLRRAEHASASRLRRRSGHWRRLRIRRKNMANEPSETSSGPEIAAQTRTQSAATLAHSEKEKDAQPIYLDSAEGYRRLEESHRRSFVTLGMFFLSQETQTFCGVASSTMALNALVSKDERPLVPEWSPYCLFAQSVFFTPEVEEIAPRNGVLANGMPLQQLGDALGTFPVKVGVSHASDKSEED